MSLRARLSLWFLLLLTAAGRLWVATADYKSLIANDVWQDDAFYYLQVARNVATGRGFTFDGHTPTNGFQPLFQLLLVPVMYFSRGDLVAPIHAVSVLLAGWAVATGGLLFALARRLAGTGVGLTALAIWAVSPYFILYSVNGQETGPAMFFAALLVLLYVRWVRAPGGARLRQYAVLGLVAGAAVLTRVDAAILLLGLAVDWLWQLARRPRSLPQLRGAALTGVIALGTWLPWGYASERLSGHWLPLSGPASRQIALNYGWSNLEPIWSRPRAEDHLFDPAHVPPAYYADVATKAAILFVLECPLFAPLRVNVPFAPWPALNRYVPYLGIKGHPTATMIGVGVLALAIVVLARVFARRRSQGDAGTHWPQLHWALGTYLIVLLAAYTFYAPAHWFFGRYLSAPVLLATIWGAALARLGWQGLAGRGRAARVGLWGGAAILIGCQLMQIDTLLRLHVTRLPRGGFLASWQQLGPQIDPTARVGAFQAGIIGYFSQRDVVNLDGKVNGAAYEAIRNRRLYQYVREQHIDYIVDWEWVLYCLCLRDAPRGALPIQRVGREPAGARLALFYVESAEPVKGW